MTELKTLIGQRFWLGTSDHYMPAVYEACQPRDVQDGPYASVGCHPVGWSSGEPSDKLVWLSAHDVADAIRVQGEPDPRYPLGAGATRSIVRALITRATQGTTTSNGHCPGCGHPREDSQS